MNILNDTEHRLFLSAMQREKKICEQFDNSCDSGIKLLPICRSIEQKVDKAIEPKRGHWIDIHEYHYYNDGDIETTELRCSCCNETVEWDIELLHKPFFCENCGADMREVKK